MLMTTQIIYCSATTRRAPKRAPEVPGLPVIAEENQSIFIGFCGDSVGGSLDVALTDRPSHVLDSLQRGFFTSALCGGRAGLHTCGRGSRRLF